MVIGRSKTVACMQLVSQIEPMTFELNRIQKYGFAYIFFICMLFSSFLLFVFIALKWLLNTYFSESKDFISPH